MKKSVIVNLKFKKHIFFPGDLVTCFLKGFLILLSLFFSLCLNSGYAGVEEMLLREQGNKESRDFIEKIVKSEIRKRSSEKLSDPGQIIRTLMEMDCGDIKAFSPYDERLLEAAVEDRKWDWGLRFDSGYRFSESETYTSRHAGYVGLSWDLLKSGLFQARSRMRENNLKLGLVRLQKSEDRGKRMLLCREIRLAQFFSKLKTPLIKLKYDLLVVEYRAVRRAYFSGSILVDDLIKMEGRLKEAEEALKLQDELNSFSIDNGSFLPVEKGPPLLRIKLGPLLKAVKNESVYPEAVKLNEEILKEKSKTLNNNLLRLYFRSGVDSEDGETDYGTVVFGVRLSVPIGRSGRRESLVRLKKSRFEGSMKLQQRLLETVRLFNGYEDKMEAAININHREFVSKERLRRAWLLSGIRGGGSLTDVIRSLSELTDVRIKALSVKESLYRKLLYMFTRSGAGYGDEFVELASGSHSVLRGRVGKRSMYLWSESFNRYKNDFLIQVFAAKSVSRVMLSYSGKSDPEKLKSFLVLARDSGVYVELMAGTNEWIFPEKRSRLAGFAKRAFSMAEAVHLDVEPHTLEGYAGNEAEYKQLYLDMVRNAASEGAGKSISVSIPLKWSGPVFESISGIVDRVYLMAYGVTDPEKLEKRLAPFLRLGTEKVVIAVRPADFSDEWEMEKFLDDMFLRTGVGEFAIHDLGDFLKMVSRENL